VRPAQLALSLVVLGGCGPSAPSGICDETAWVAESDPLAFSLEASGAATWSAADVTAPISLTGILSSAEAGGVGTVVRVETDAGELVLSIGLPRDRLGVLPIGETVEVRLGDGITILDAEARIRAALVSRRGSDHAVAGDVTFRQAYAECVSTLEQATCTRAMASPLVDVISGASVVRLPPGGVWRIPDDEDPSTEITIVRSVRRPYDDELATDVLCDETPAQELAVIVRRLR
jgi:hypothetical protein